ncbi:MAG: hypothetical protein J6T72_00325 [Alphaproteobacteria bacterium]|nr:hypothetical protein [Alphaproteobacteria bacterium]
MENLDLCNQVNLVADADKKAFGHYVEKYGLKSHAILKLFKSNIFQGKEKFELYVKLRGQFKLEDERRLLESRRRDLQEIYFKYCPCHGANERLIVKNPQLAALYYKEHCPCALAQRELLQAKPKSIYLFIRAYPFSPKVRGLFMEVADVRLRNYYLLKHPA